MSLKQKTQTPAVAAVLLLLATPAIADISQSWVLVATGQNHNQFFLNTRTLVKQGAIVNYDTMVRLAQPNSDGIAAMGFQVQGHCLQNKTRELGVASYDQQFQVITDRDGDRKWQKLKPGSVAFIELRKACDLVRK